MFTRHRKLIALSAYAVAAAVRDLVRLIPTSVDKIHLVETVISDATMDRLEPFPAWMEGPSDTFPSKGIRCLLMELLEGSAAGVVTNGGRGVRSGASEQAQLLELFREGGVTS